MALVGKNSVPDIMIKREGTVSDALLDMHINTYVDATNYVKQLPYGRNVNKNDILCVLKEGVGTCSTKHALLKRLAIEQGDDQVKLVLGIFRMGRSYSRKIVNTLDWYQLEYIPEAHMYLSINGEIVDCTNVSSSAKDFVDDLILECEFDPEEIGDFKINYHKNFLKNWLVDDKNITYSLEEIFSIREQCIMDLSS